MFGLMKEIGETYAAFTTTNDEKHMDKKQILESNVNKPVVISCTVGVAFFDVPGILHHGGLCEYQVTVAPYVNLGFRSDMVTLGETALGTLHIKVQ